MGYIIMTYTTFNQNKFDALKEPMFFGETVNIARYDQQKYPEIDQLTQKQLSFFWRPEEVDVSQDRLDFLKLSESEQHVITSNLKFQTLLDSVASRTPSMAFLPIVSLPELETWIETWAFSETIHSRSYTHIIRNVYNDPSEVFDDIIVNQSIISRAAGVTRYYDDLIGAVNHHQHEGLQPNYYIRKKLYLALIAANVLEALRFYVSFACTFSFCERALMEGSAKIVKLIARDEYLHLQGTQFILNKFASGDEGREMFEVACDCKEEAINIFKTAVEEEKSWGDYLFKNGSILGLNKEVLSQYVEYMANIRMKAINLEPQYDIKTNPLPWMDSYINSDNVQVAPQETEISSYLVGAIDSEVNTDDFSDFSI